MKISVVIPTLNEAQGIAPLIKKCKEFAFEVIVVDGDSKDGTAKVAAEAGARVISEKRPGYGQAYLTGFSQVRGDVIATGDGDGTYPVELAPQIVQKLLEENLAFISCSRFPLKAPENMPLTNQLGNTALSLVGSLLWNHHFQDVLSGMWIFKKEILKDLDLVSKNWNLSQEIKIAAYARFKERFQEVHIPYHQRTGVPKLSPWRVGRENLTFFFVQRLGLRKFLDRP